MAAPRRFVLIDAEVRRRCADFVIREARDGYEVIVREPKRSDAASAKFHAICRDLERSGLKWAGKARKSGEWKVLLVSGHAVVTKEGAEMIPGLENEFVNVRESTASMSKSRTGSLIEYAMAFCANHGVRLSAPDD